MKHLKLVVNNRNIKKDIFFNKKELKLILNLYAEMVSGGEWKDYGLSISKKEVSFNVSHRASEFPAYKITKKPLLKIFFQTAMNLENEGWKKLNDHWIGFFLFIAILNEIVWRTQSEAFWVNFKVWGLLPISFLFAASQISLINKYKLKQ